MRKYFSAAGNIIGVMGLTAVLSMIGGWAVPVPAAAGQEAKLEAAVKLFAVYVAVIESCRRCAGWDYPKEAQAAEEGYNRRNGNSLRLVNRAINESGGSAASLRSSIDAHKVGYQAQALADKEDCPNFLADLNAGHWDLYKGRPWANEYQRLKSE